MNLAIHGNYQEKIYIIVSFYTNYLIYIGFLYQKTKNKLPKFFIDMIALLHLCSSNKF